MSQPVYRRRNAAGYGLEQCAAAIREPKAASDVKIRDVPTDLDALKANGESYTLESFTIEDAIELGHLLQARLLPLSKEKPTLVSISLANSNQVVFQTAVGSGVAPDNETWVARKRNSVMRWNTATWFLSCKFGQDEALFASKFGMSTEQAGKYAIHGGGVPIRVRGVEGIVGVVIVSGLKQDQDHGVIMDVIEENWERV
ncbi:hypothetical protein B0T11DRAFT_56553 [Plectosphaerella cucumerina]|uniref:Uncharacterized protein n=1 Tax=Plectosphaerella cucumerina TaxID=40658 RepID=A0A8K0TIC5_9PEZI|nr:hypothetical protein B0T11DRAFT_56553 [Plectosphaerella cucumerina]